MATAQQTEASHGVPASRQLVQRVRIRNYKSIGRCDVPLGPFTVLVGRNGAGKSNFLDALRFVSDSLLTSLDHAIKSRSGTKAVRRQSTGHPHNFAVVLTLGLPDWSEAVYGFEVAAKPDGGFWVKEENLRITSARGETTAHYRIVEGRVVKSSHPTMPPAVSDRLYLVVAAGLPEFRGAYDALTSMGFYNLNPQSMKELQSPDAGELLHRDGDNIASVISRLAKDAPHEKKRCEQYLNKIVSGIVGMDRVQLGPRETVEFRQDVEGSSHPWRFHAANMSDGTLRALGVLVAVSQLVYPTSRIRLVGIEEPETALHPAASGALMDALDEASEHTQILVTTHSADLLDQMEAAPSGILAVQARKGETFIAPLSEASKDAIRDHLYGAGELLRMDQIEPDEQDIARQKQIPLFDSEIPES